MQQFRHKTDKKSFQDVSVLSSKILLRVEVYVLFVTKLHSTNAYLDVLHNMYFKSLKQCITKGAVL